MLMCSTRLTINREIESFPEVKVKIFETNLFFCWVDRNHLVIGPTRRALEAARNSETSSKCFIALREATPLI